MTEQEESTEDECELCGKITKQLMICADCQGQIVQARTKPKRKGDNQ